jgi:hypothetical protein
MQSIRAGINPRPQARLIAAEQGVPYKGGDPTSGPRVIQFTFAKGRLEKMDPHHRCVAPPVSHPSGAKLTVPEACIEETNRRLDEALTHPRTLGGH